MRSLRFIGILAALVPALAFAQGTPHRVAGGISESGTPAANQVAIWGAGTVLKGDSNLTWDSTHGTLNFGASSGQSAITLGTEGAYICINPSCSEKIYGDGFGIFRATAHDFTFTSANDGVFNVEYQLNIAALDNNSLTINGASTGNPVTMTTVGTNAGLTVTTQGTGALSLGTSTTTQPVKIAGGSGAFVAHDTLSSGTKTKTVPTGAVCSCTSETANAVHQSVSSTTLTVTGTGSDAFDCVCL